MERLTIAECRALLDECGPDELPSVIAALAADTRAGVRAAIARAERRVRRRDALFARWHGLARVERELHDGGVAFVAGVDEVGLGALAGPLTAGAVVLDLEKPLLGLDDSKRLTPSRRGELAHTIRAACVAWAVSHTQAADVDRLGVSEAKRRAMRAAVDALGLEVDHVVVDGHPVGLSDIAETAVVGGDSTVAAIAAASIVAKVERDALMVRLARSYPGYGFDVNKGYGTRQHLDAIGTLGLTPVHRRSYAPCEGTPPLF